MISEDEERESMFFELEQNELFQPSHPILEEEFDADHKPEPVNYVEHYKHLQDDNNTLFEEFGFLTGGQRNSFERFSMHNKSITGLRGMVTLDGKERRQDAFSSPEDIGLSGFFAEEDSTYPKLIFEKCFVGLSQSISKIDFNLVENFDNYLYIEKSNNNQFAERMKTSYLETLKLLSKKKNPLELFGDIFGFWVDCFKKMLLEVEKCSPLYTLNTFKKQKDNPFIMEPEEPSIQQDQPKQRRLWTKSEMSVLSQLIECNTPVPSSKIQEVASELGRSVLAVQSKMQKLQKEKKQKPNDLSLEKKMLIVLTGSPAGMSKEELLTRMEAQFQMGDQEAWRKSVSQLLSTSKRVSKSKGIFGFTSVPSLEPPNNFKNKVIACLYELPGQSGNLKAITHKYVQKFSTQENLNREDTERIKCIEANIYKTIFKYDIFDKSNSKIVYRYYDTERQNASKDSHSESDSNKDSLPL